MPRSIPGGRFAIANLGAMVAIGGQECPRSVLACLAVGWFIQCDCVGLFVAFKGGTANGFTSAVSASSRAMERRIKIQAMSQTRGKKRMPRISQVRVKPKTRLAINSGKK